MTLEKRFLIIVLVAIALAVPTAFAFKDRAHQLKIERMEKSNLQIKIDTKQKQLELKENQLKQEQKKSEDLQKKLEAKRKAKEKLAQAPPAPVAISGNCDAYKKIVAQYDWDVRVALAIMRAESTCNPNAVSPPNYDGLRDHGLMQLHGVAIYDPAKNIAYAYNNKYLHGGWSHWTVYNTGAYAKYL